MEELKKLIQQNKKEDLNEILKLSTDLFQQNQNDSNLFKVMVISSIKLGKDVSQYEENMKKSGMNYEIALNKYINGQYDEAITLLGNDERDKVLKAQILQKKEKYSEAAKLYSEVLETTKESKTNILTNLAACISSDASIDPKLLGNKTSDFVSETYGNAALVMLRKGEFTKAESYFNKALGASALTSSTTKTEEKGEFKFSEDESKLREMQKRKEKRQRRRQKQMAKKHGKVDPKTLDPERWLPLYQRKKNQKKGGKK